MQTRISHIIFTCLLLLACSGMSVMARPSATASDTLPAFPPDPGELYIPSVLIIMGDTVEMGDSTSVIPTEIDVFGDQTVVYQTEENVLTLTNANLSASDSMSIAIDYSGTDPLVIVLCDSSSLIADTVIQSTSDVYITGEGWMEAVGQVPIIGSLDATITFDSVSLYACSLPSKEAVRRRIRGVRMVDETGGPALSGFGSADFNKTNVSPSDAEYTEVSLGSSGSEEEEVINALAVLNDEGEYEALTEFTLTAVADDDDAVEDIRIRHEFDPALPTFNILGMQVDATYKGIVVQQGQTYLLQ